MLPPQTSQGAQRWISDLENKSGNIITIIGFCEFLRALGKKKLIRGWILKIKLIHLIPGACQGPIIEVN